MLRNFLTAVVVLYMSMIGLSAVRVNTALQPSGEQLVAVIAALAVFVKLQSHKRSRYIVRATRRAVIARDLKGEPYDASEHHIDHVWPFSKGGSNTSDNLRVIEKGKNLKKGAKRPRMREMW